MRKPDDDEDRVLRDGKSLHVPLMLMDELQQAVAAGTEHYGFASDAHHGIPSDAQVKDARARADAAWEKRGRILSNAWRGADAEPAPVMIDDWQSITLADARALADAAWERRGHILANAWRARRGAEVKPAPVIDDWQSVTLADARARADAAWEKRGELLANAWRIKG